MIRVNRIKTLVLGTIIGMVIFSILPLRWCLEVVDEDGKVWIRQPVHRNLTIEMHWIHSVELEPWIERFKVQSNQLMLESTSFKAFGAGVPDTEYRDVIVEDGWVTYPHIDRVMDSLVYRISSIAEHQIVIDGKQIPLYAYLDNKAITLQLRKCNMYQWMSITGENNDAGLNY